MLVFGHQLYTVKCTVFFFFHWLYSPWWALVCRTMSFHFFISVTNSLHLLTPSTWRSLSTSFHPIILGLPLRLVPSRSSVKIFLGILSSILSRWPNQLILCPFIHFTIFSPLLISSSSRFVLLFQTIYLPTYIYLRVVYLSIYLSVYLFLSVSTYLSIYLSISFTLVHRVTGFHSPWLPV